RAAGVRRLEQPPDFFRFPLDGRIHPSLDRGKVMSGSTDVGDVSWITPTVEVRTTCWPVGIPGHSWGITASSGTSIGHKGMLQAAKAMAYLAAELGEGPSRPEPARAELEEATPGRASRTPLPEGTRPPIPQPRS